VQEDWIGVKEGKEREERKERKKQREREDTVYREEN
jgi:hypothetical protein